MINLSKFNKVKTSDINTPAGKDAVQIHENKFWLVEDECVFIKHLDGVMCNSSKGII